ncbi:YybH family protein [Maribellus maritimus]|uniref:YybH family protein n=1 Tax=Maribellus maritimus TaxID=2870838 RepID=UPI001EECAD0E|nr:SgcJ/EcaC family oxidoreductase [Maribellus maritimus]MCG6189421.1 SgcJ/EcaC family oxidoreductase [Maribellus maritimus]
MKKLTVVILSLFIVISCLGQDKMEKKDRTEISSLLKKQVDAWNAGNLEKFMETYWNSDSLVFVGGSGPTYGWQKTLENYKKRYPTRAEMGETHFKILRMSKIDDKTVFVIGRYELTREMGNLAGHFTLIIQNIDGKWLIISDHSSAES